MKEINSNILSDITVHMKYAKYNPDLQRRETWNELVDRNIMYAKIFLKPARAIEYIAIDFVVTSTGASFED